MGIYGLSATCLKKKQQGRAGPRTDFAPRIADETYPQPFNTFPTLAKGEVPWRAAAGPPDVLVIVKVDPVQVAAPLASANSGSLCQARYWKILRNVVSSFLFYQVGKLCPLLQYVRERHLVQDIWNGLFLSQRRRFCKSEKLP